MTICKFYSAIPAMNKFSNCKATALLRLTVIYLKSLSRLTISSSNKALQIKLTSPRAHTCLFEPVADRDPGTGPRSGAGMAFSSRPRPRPHFTNWPGFCGRDPGRRSPVWCRDSILIPAPAPAKLKNWPGFWPGIYHLQYKIANYF